MNKILTIIGCHTNSQIKIDALLHNMKYFMELSNTIAIVNSSEFVDLHIEVRLKKVYPNTNIIFNDVLSDDLCYIYKTKYVDLCNFNNDQLREHWIRYGKREKRGFSFPVYDVYFDYKKNDKFISHGKWLYFLNRFDYSSYDHVVLTNDSFIITRSLLDLTALVEPNTELVTILDSYQSKYHYPDYLRIYNSVGLSKIIQYYETNMSHITDFASVINTFEIGSSCIFDDVKVLYKNNGDFDGNIHFDNYYLEEYLYRRNYPIVKIKKLLSNYYVDKTIPDDFIAREYKFLNVDLIGFTDTDAYNHFKNHGIFEGRQYKKNQRCKLPDFLEHYMNLIGFKLQY